MVIEVLKIPFYESEKIPALIRKLNAQTISIFNI